MFFSISSLLCFLDSMSTSPPSLIFEGMAYFSLYPVDRISCPDINPYRDVIFELFTDKNPNKSQTLLLGDDNSIKKSNLNFNQPTIFFFHGFREVIQSGSPDQIRQAYLKRGGHNIILVDAHVLLAGPWYKNSAQNTRAIGKYTATFIDYLVAKGLNLKKIHLIGHSLGGHSAGVCGHNVQSGRIPRITGLDPALSRFRHADLSLKLDTSDAEFVDIIHTSGGLWGVLKSIGHADFFPNGGVATQPECSFSQILLRRSSAPILEIILCSHWQSYIFYAESVINPIAFNSSSATSWNDFKKKQINSGFTTYMGYAVSKQTRGDFYLSTK